MEVGSYPVSEKPQYNVNDLNKTTHYGFRPNALNFSQSIPHPQKAPVSFSGSTDKFLSTLGNSGKNPVFPVAVSSLGAILFRIPIILSNKKTPKEERSYAAAWCGVTCAIGLTTQLLLKKPIENLSKNLARKFLGSVKNVKNMPVKALSGTSKMFEFVSWIVALNTLSIGIAAYLKRGIDFINQKFKGQPLEDSSPKKPMTEKEQIRQKKLDKLVIRGLTAIGSFVGLNLIGRVLNKGPIANKAVTTAYNKLNQSFNINSHLNNLWTKTKNTVFKLAKGDGIINKAAKKVSDKATWLHSEQGVNWLAQQADASDKWLERNVLVNAIVRPLILLPTKQYYTIISSFVNEALTFASIKTAGNFLAKKATPVLESVLNIKSDSAKAGVGVIVDQLVKNIGVVCIGMGFLNNSISSTMLNILKRFEKNKGPEPKTPSQYISKINNSQNTTVPTDMEIWLKSIQNNKKVAFNTPK